MKEIFKLEGQKILLTGGGGFTGNAMIHRLMSKFYKNLEFHLLVIDKMSYNSSYKSLREYEKCINFTFVKSDVNETKKILGLMKKFQIDIVFHIAAETHVDHSFANSMKFTRSNVLGTHSMLEAARIYGLLKRFIHISTDETYGTTKNIACTEKLSLLRPTNPYAATKAGAEQLAFAYYKSYNIPIMITRGSNIYGYRQFPDKVIPKWIELLIRKKSLVIHDNYGRGEMIRSFIQVEDVCSAFECITTKGMIGEIYNITNNFECSINLLAHKLLNLFGYEKHYNMITLIEGRKFNDHRYFISNKKLLSLGWNSIINFEEGLLGTIKWYKENPNYFGKKLTNCVIEKNSFLPEEEKFIKNDHQNIKIICPNLINGIRILIFGGGGWIGNQTYIMLKQAKYIVKKAKSRLEDRQAIFIEIEKFEPTHVLNCAGITGIRSVDDCEENKESTVRSNVIGTLNLCDICFLHDLHLTNLATGCIYLYDNIKPMSLYDKKTNNWISGINFRENDYPNFDGSWYSKTKSFVDRILFNAFPNVLTLRLRMPISDKINKKNFVSKIARYEKLVDIPNSMSVLYDLIPLMCSMMNASKTGIFNFTNPGVISHNQVINLFKKFIDPTKEVTNFSIKEHNKILKSKRSNNELNCSKLLTCANDLSISIPPIKKSVEICLKRMTENIK